MHHYLTKHLTPMPTFLSFFLVLLFLGQCTTTIDVAGAYGDVGIECLMVSPSEFVVSLRTSVDVLEDVTSTLSNFTYYSRNDLGEFQFSNAISDCMELLDLSSDQLSLSISATESPQGQVSTQHVHFPSWVEPHDQNLLQTGEVAVDVVVAADGSGNYKTVMEAVNAAPEYSMRRFVVFIKKGVYIENVVIDKKKWNLMIIGEGMDETIISGSLSKTVNLTTYKTATFATNGRGFIARDISFKNTAGPEKNQAVALRSDSDLSVFYRCGIFGYQDTLYAHTLRQFYRECKITGTVDFICGNATAVFQNCQILAKKGLQDQKNTITAQSARYPNQSSCFSIQFSNISADYDLLPFTKSIKTYLGRPWKAYSKTVFMQSYISDVLSPEGWLEWNGSIYLDTLYYAEYQNYGPGSALDKRVKWPGYHVLNDSNQASNFTVAQLIHGDLWLPLTGVNFTLGF
ncbi:PREDICTED: pectinesterase/pectinesterase inhibitor PPE8B-like isoform X2 [Lupinus angustifolius]|uniref:pectinesterase/pectinesterase inhibitor PPE8B-like isoform X2 n=1 Tax=Lupinus angustifolius TaxID=3871 RepID=UPI00092F608E|nr:PREDICTED: pectinesterase/pectinesterase inhibitor PPE8B-like isoform X2 [Lupinus angustifolius]